MRKFLGQFLTRKRKFEQILASVQTFTGTIHLGLPYPYDGVIEKAIQDEAKNVGVDRVSFYYGFS